LGEKMEFYNAKPNGNQHSDLEPARYFNLAFAQLNEISEAYKTLDKPYHVMAIHLEILLMLCEKYPDFQDYVQSKEKLSEWKQSFCKWYDRCKNKIPQKYREEIKKSTEELFVKLNEFITKKAEKKMLTPKQIAQNKLEEEKEIGIDSEEKIIKLIDKINKMEQ
jgi:hypothetical protein